MNSANLARQLQIDALGGDLRPCEHLPRPILCPIRTSTAGIGGRR
jgi:hypothetical protein